MRFMTRIGAVVLAAGLAMPAAAQDSVSNMAGLPGDAVGPWSLVEQINDYVVDLSPFQTSGGTTFGIAPIIKSSKSSSAFFSSVISAQGISAFTQAPSDFIGQEYAVWGGAGFGVNDDPNRNDQPDFIAPPAVGVRQGVAFAEFSTTDAGASMNNIISGLVQFEPSNPGRLFVRRIVAATNDETGAENEAQIGFGGVDSNATVYFRADDFGLSGSNPITGNNYIWVQSAMRDPSIVNAITAKSGITDGDDTAVTSAPINASPTTHSTPTGIDSSIAGRPVITGADFDSNYVYESAPGVIAVSTAHRPGAVDQRGNVHHTTRTLFANSIGTSGMITRPNSTDNTSVSVWGVDANGAPGAAATVVMPAIIEDKSAVDPHTFPFDPEFTNYQSQAAFRGGNGQIAIGRDAEGRALVAGAITGLGFGNNDPEGGIAVARFDPANPGATLEWGLAAWNAFPISGAPFGKGIFDADGARIGELALLSEVTGGTPLGPSFSSPTIDAAGNIWFLAAAQLYRGLGPDEQTGETDDDFDTVLLRAVYDEASFSWTLELILEQGQVFSGLNSQRDWQVRFISVADSNSIDSSTIFSGNMNQTAFAGDPINTWSADPRDARNLGGLVLQAEIVYDVNQDGQFNKVTGATGDPTSLDQEYNVLLYIGALPAQPCPTDFNGDGATDGADLGVLLGNWGGGGATDFNADGVTDGADLGVLLGAWGPCP